MSTGPREAAVRRELRAYPLALRRCAIAVAAALLARQLDTGLCCQAGEDWVHVPVPIPPRDVTMMVRELRQCMTVLREMAPGEVKGDVTDQAATGREARLLALPGHAAQ